MRDNWQLYRGALPNDLCETIIQNSLKLPEQEASTFSGNNEHRKSKVRWIDSANGLAGILMPYVIRANAEAFNVNIQQEMGEMQFTEYQSETNDKYDWHHDINWENEKHFDRKLSVVVQLTAPNTYEGGQFEFAEVQSPKPVDFRQQGSVLVFPSYLQHRVTEVTSGCRYSLVSWVRGPRWR
jgi:PKHD-type hydroxylase